MCNTTHQCRGCGSFDTHHKHGGDFVPPFRYATVTPARRHAALTDAVGWLTDQVARLSYRPGWTFSVTADTDLAVVTLVTAMVTEDVERPGERTRVFDEQDVTGLAIRGQEATLDWLLQRCIGGIENHERCEFLRRDGVPIVEPHPYRSRL